MIAGGLNIKYLPASVGALLLTRRLQCSFALGRLAECCFN